MNFLPDKSWMDIGYRLDPTYISGVESFLEFALANTKRLTHGHIPCPCKKCRNTSILERDVVYEHLMVNGILGDYRVWSRHGEIPLPSSNIITSTERCDDGVQDMIHDAFIIGDEDDDEDVEDAFASAEEDEDAKNFFKLIEEAEKPLHSGPGSPSKLKFLVELYHIKCLHGWSNKSFSMLLTCLREAIPGGDESLPKSFYEVKKLIAALGLDYNKIDACSNDCMLYYKENAKKEECDICHTSRWKFMSQDEGSNTEKSKKVPMKILRHFPLIPRLQRLFMSSKVASSMTWHHNHRVKDGILRHPAVSDSWKTLDKEYSNFSTDPRNVRLGLASDGFKM